MNAADFAGIEAAYEGLAQGIDAAGPQHEALFLARLVLLLAARSGDPAIFEECVAAALADLPADRATTLSAALAR